MNILAVGAYERDNFGDLLFLYVLRSVLKDKARIVPSSIMFSDMRDVNGEVIFPYSFLLKKYKFDGIITVGGEVGGVDVVGALMMDISKKERESIFKNKQDLNRIVEFYTGIQQDKEKHAYIIDRSEYPLNLDTPNILNSVGLSNIQSLNSKFLKRTKGLLSKSIISVREEKSLNLMNEYGIRSEISPDIVHSICTFRKKKKSNQRYVVFQINNELIKTKEISHKIIAEKLKIIANSVNSDIKLFLAGVTEGHDNIDDYEKIVDEFLKIENKKGISIIKERDPLKLVDYISGSVMWIGTSLHGRIISASYDIPRISLYNNKVSNYAEKWDPKMPYGILIDEINEEICKNTLTNDVKIGKELSSLALGGFEKILNKANLSSFDNEIDDSRIFFDYVDYLREESIETIQEKNSIIGNIEENNKKLYDENMYYKKTIEDIKNSNMYKIGEKISGVKSTLKNR